MASGFPSRYAEGPPFDHPSLGIASDHKGDATSAQLSSSGSRVSDAFGVLPRVGKNGVVALPARPNFLGVVE